MIIGAVIIAGGDGRRIGGNKPVRRLAGRSLLEHVLAQVRAWNLPCAVAVRDPSQADLAAGLPLLIDREGEGPIAGIASALRHAEALDLDAVLTLPCDTPLLPADLPVRLAAALVLPARAVIARSGGRLHPSCALWSREAAGSLQEYLANGSSLGGFARHVDAATVDWPLEPFDPFFNVNNADDLAEAERLLARR